MFQPVVSLLTVIQTLTMDKITFNKYMLGIYGVLHFFEQTALLESTTRFASEDLYSVSVCVLNFANVCELGSCNCDRWLTQLICLIGFMCSDES